MSLIVNPEEHNPDPDYLRDLLARAGISQRLAARLINVDDRMFRKFLTGDHKCPYSVQFVLEYLAENPPRKEDYAWGQPDG